MHSTHYLTQLFYTAGLLEGEGYFDASNRIAITVTMTDLEPLKFLQEWWGGSIYVVKPTRTGKATWRYHLGRTQGVMELISDLLPLMSPRRQLRLQAMIERDKTQHRQIAGGEHGSMYKYFQGCRCEPCVTRMRGQRKRTKARIKVLEENQ